MGTASVNLLLHSIKLSYGLQLLLGWSGKKDIDGCVTLYSHNWVEWEEIRYGILFQCISLEKISHIHKLKNAVLMPLHYSKCAH